MLEVQEVDPLPVFLASRYFSYAQEFDGFRFSRAQGITACAVGNRESGSEEAKSECAFNTGTGSFAAIGGNCLQATKKAFPCRGTLAPREIYKGVYL